MTDEYFWIKDKKRIVTDLMIGVKNKHVVCFEKDCLVNGEPSDKCKHVKFIKKDEELRTLLIRKGADESYM